jgi:uncharacterized Fe-S cluster-containing radical SAM superfamily protein
VSSPLIPKDYLFILETNGILIGSDPSYAEELSGFDNIKALTKTKIEELTSSTSNLDSPVQSFY